MRKSSKEKNSELLEALAGREEVLRTFTAGEDLDDEQVARVERFRRCFDGWTQVDRDVFYLCLTRNVSECARLLQVSRRLIDKRYKELCKEFM